MEPMDWPSESPDLSPIELVWSHMKSWLRTECKPTTAKELKEGILHYWKHILTIDLCNKFIDHIYTQLHEVIASNGAPIIDK